MLPSCRGGKWTPGKGIPFSSMQACWADGQRRASSTGILRGEFSVAYRKQIRGCLLLELPGPGPCTLHPH